MKFKIFYLNLISIKLITTQMNRVFVVCIDEHNNISIWKTAAFLGQGAAKSINDTIYVVFNYNPERIVPDEYEKNVFPKITNNSANQTRATSANSKYPLFA